MDDESYCFAIGGGFQRPFRTAWSGQYTRRRELLEANTGQISGGTSSRPGDKGGGDYKEAASDPAVRICIPQTVK